MMVVVSCSHPLHVTSSAAPTSKPVVAQAVQTPAAIVERDAEAPFPLDALDEHERIVAWNSGRQVWSRPSPTCSDQRPPYTQTLRCIAGPIELVAQIAELSPKATACYLNGATRGFFERRTMRFTSRAGSWVIDPRDASLPLASCVVDVLNQLPTITAGVVVESRRVTWE